MFHTPDNYSRWQQHDTEQENRLNELPECSECGEHIQSDFCYEVNGEYICEECMEGHKKYTEDLI